MIGQTVSHYKIVEELGRGGMGVVYLATDLDLDRQVAIKFLPEQLTKDKENVERFRREARAAAALNHPNIITIYEIGHIDNDHFLVMEYLSGETLRERLQRDVQLSFNMVANIIEQLSDALESAHHAGILHRDIKPENIFITTGGRVKILDFGLAKLRGSNKLTKDFSTLGTINYISPEQARGEETGIPSDVWATGILLYEMICGQVPFKGDYDQAIIYSILNEAPQPMNIHRPDCPDELNKRVLKSMEKDSAHRYQSVSQLAAEVNSVLKTQEESTSKKKPHPKFLSKWIYAILALTVLVLTVLFLLLPNDDKDLDKLSVDTASLIEERDYNGAYQLIVDAGFEISKIQEAELFSHTVGYVSIDSRPQKSTVSIKRIRSIPELATEAAVQIGKTPIHHQQLFAGEYLIELRLSGYQSLQFISDMHPGDSVNIFRTLPAFDSQVAGMVLVQPGLSFQGNPVSAFYIDRYEVTNEQYFVFISAGGYRQQDFWPEQMLIQKTMRPGGVAINTFIDQTGIPAPRHWSNGRYPDGSEMQPVTGITWYEANAYARWADKQLPDWDQWWRAAIGDTERIYPWGREITTIAERANFSSLSVQPVGSFVLGVSPYGCYDMAGNVSEWLRDDQDESAVAIAVGGSWQNPSYMFEASHAQFLPRDYNSQDLGFRCVKPIQGKNLNDTKSVNERP